MLSKRTLRSLALGALIGAAAGVGVYTFVYAKDASYLTNNPASCANCHVMNEQYDGWLKSSHRGIATCNDCQSRPRIPPDSMRRRRLRESWTSQSTSRDRGRTRYAARRN